MSRIMVCGLGQVGYRVASLLLDLGEDVTIITLESRDEWLKILKARGAHLVMGDARDETVLAHAGLGDCEAIIAYTHDDSANIEISLDSRKLFPEKRTIARIVDPSLARQSERHLGVHRAIAMTAAAAPTFAAATYGDHVLTEFTVGEERLLALRITGPQTLLEAPLVLISPDGAYTDSESRELKVDELAVLIVKAESMAEQVPKRRRHSLLKALAPNAVGHFIAGVWTNTSVQLRAMLIVIGCLIVASVVIFQIGMKLSFVDSVYFVVTTATTTGYGDISPKDASNWVKLYTCFMMVISAAGLAVLFSMVTDYILTARLMQLVGRHHIPERGHVLVAGVGAVGHRVADELIRMKTHVVVIEQNDGNEYLATLRTRVPVVIGDAREKETLDRAGARHAKAIIAMTSKDAVNLSIGLAAKEENPDIRTVLSIFDVDFARTVQAIPELDAAMSPALMAAPTFVGAALFGDAVASFRLGRHFFTLCEDKSGPIRIAHKHMSLHVMNVVS